MTLKDACFYVRWMIKAYHCQPFSDLFVVISSEAVLNSARFQAAVHAQHKNRRQMIELLIMT